MKTKLLPTLAIVLVLCLTVWAASAQAYLHQQNVINQCDREVSQDAGANLGFFYIPVLWQNWVRYSDTDASIQLIYYNTQYWRGYICRYQGHDSSNGGVSYWFGFRANYPYGTQLR